MISPITISKVNSYQSIRLKVQLNNVLLLLLWLRCLASPNRRLCRIRKTDRFRQSFEIKVKSFYSIKYIYIKAIDELLLSINFFSLRIRIHNILRFFLSISSIFDFTFRIFSLYFSLSLFLFFYFCYYLLFFYF